MFGASARFFREKGFLETFKFCFYLVVPLGSSIIYANPDLMNKIILYYRHVEYPEEKGSDVLNSQNLELAKKNKEYYEEQIALIKKERESIKKGDNSL